MVSLELVSVRCTLWVAAVALLQLSLCVSFSEEQSCPTLSARPGSSPPDLSGLSLFIDPALDPEIGSAVPIRFDVVTETGPTLLFSSLETAQLGPAIPSTFVSLPLHAVANQELHYNVRIQSTNESIITTFSAVTPSDGLIKPGQIENITLNICCIGTGRVELVGCLFVGTESFKSLNGSYEALGPFYFGYQCSNPSPSPCPSSPSASLVLANWCATPNQSQALTASNAGDWGLLLGAFGVDSRGLCIIDEFEDGVHPLLRVDVNINRLPIPYNFSVLNFYLQKSYESNPSSPILYNVTVSPVNSSIVGYLSVNIPATGLLEDNSRQHFDIFQTCNESGVTPISLLFNFTAFKDGFLLHDSYDLYFLKNCTPPPGNRTIVSRSGPNVALIVPVTVVPVVIVMVIVVIIVLVIVGMTRRQKMETEQLEQLAKDQATKNLYTMTTVSNPFEFLDQYQIEYNFALLEVVDQLGEGAFGRVYKARAPGLHRGDYQAGEFVAVKSLKDDGMVDEFCKEVKVCVRFEHDNVIRLLGVCTASAQKCMIFEYMDCGSLHDMLHKSDPNNPSYDPNSSSFLLRPDHLLPIAIQLGRGLEYLATLNFVHRDIATRNCLIDSSLNAKIADFGLSRDISAQNYYRVGGAKAYMPVRWMPPEALLYGKFTLKSDVWSFAILIWEMYTFGQLPYTGISDHEAIDCVKEARGLDNTPLCPLGVYSIMRTCWTRVPSRRPTMEQVRQQLEAFSEGKQAPSTSYVNLAPTGSKTLPPSSSKTEVDTAQFSLSLNINHHDAVTVLEPPALTKDDSQIKDPINN